MKIFGAQTRGNVFFYFFLYTLRQGEDVGFESLTPA